MNEKDLLKLGIPTGPALKKALDLCRQGREKGLPEKQIRRAMRRLLRDLEGHTRQDEWGALARLILAEKGEATRAASAVRAPYTLFGKGLDAASIAQLETACALPIAVRGALMPDAHLGYGLPIGGVIATRGAVIPYAVGVDIACRMRLSVLAAPLTLLESRREGLKKAIAEETRFGVGATFSQPRAHAVMDRSWEVSPVTRTLKDRAWRQLGTSGGGNHFVEFGVLEITDPSLGLERGSYLALLSHSGSRGTGAEVCQHYSKIARKQHQDLPQAAQHLGWLDLASEAGVEYWAAMELMGEYAAANHELIHQHIARNLGVAVRLTVENHHNFAWKEDHAGESLVVHRKGATPASAGALGVIPGSMATPGFVVRGLGNAESLCSAAHGAGRLLSRKQALKRYRWKDALPILEKNRVEVISAGIDETPMVYKDIHQVMAAQETLVRPLARFEPRLVKMAP